MSFPNTKRGRILGKAGLALASAARRTATLIAVCAATAAFADPSMDSGATGARGSGEGVMRQLLAWQTCFKRDGTRDLPVILDACDRLAANPDLLPNQREFLAKWRVKLSKGDQTQESKSEAKDPESATRIDGRQ
jgi:hypothetical protein